MDDEGLEEIKEAVGERYHNIRACEDGRYKVRCLHRYMCIYDIQGERGVNSDLGI